MFEGRLSFFPIYSCIIEMVGMSGQEVNREYWHEDKIKTYRNNGNVVWELICTTARRFVGEER